MKSAYWTAFSAVVAAVNLSGCGSKPVENTPGAVAQAFVDAMAAGDTSAAASLWDYVAEARQQSDTWDDIPPGRRQQIILELQEQKAQALEGMLSHFGDGMQAGQSAASGASATITFSGGPQGPVALSLSRTDGQWGIKAASGGRGQAMPGG